MWMTVKDLSGFIKVKEKTLYYLVRQGAIPHYRIGKLVRFRQDEISRWMESKKAEPLAGRVDKIIRSVYTPLKGDRTASRRR